MSNKRINGPSLLLSKKEKKKEKRGIVTALPLPSSEEQRQCFARSQRSNGRTFVRASI
jgi:hypothetical protein